jgi:hypothetical protein
MAGAPLLSLEGASWNVSNKHHDRAMHWSYFTFYYLNTMYGGIVKVAQVAKGNEWKKDDFASQFAVPVTVLSGLISKTLLFTAGMKEEGWNDLEKGWNSAFYGIGVLLDIYMAYDTFLKKESASEWYDKHLDTGKQLIKIGASIGGCVLLGFRIDIWVNRKSDISDLFQTRDVLNAIALMFTFDDTSWFIKAVGAEAAAYVVVGETVVKMAAGCVHIAAVETQ